MKMYVVILIYWLVPAIHHYDKFKQHADVNATAHSKVTRNNVMSIASPIIDHVNEKYGVLQPWYYFPLASDKHRADSSFARSQW